MMPKRQSIEETKARLEKAKERLSKKFAEIEAEEHLPPEATPGGLINGPSDDLSFRRLIREIRESGSDEDDEEH